MASVSGHVKPVERKSGLVYYLKWRGADGRQVQRLLGPAWERRGRPPEGYWSRRAAEEHLEAILADERRRAPVAGSPTAVTFGQACAEWLRYGEHDKQLATSTLSDYRNVVNGYLLPEFGADTPLAHITTEVLDAYRERLLAEGRRSRRTVQKVMVLTHGILKRAKRRKWIAANPAEDVERVAVKRTGDFNVLAPVEVAAVARAAGGQDAVVFTVAAFTGLRLGELRALRWADVDFAKHTIFVRRNLPAGGAEGPPKSGKVRSVPLIDDAARELERLSRREHFTGPDDRVFCTELGGVIDDGPLRDRFYAALCAAGLGRMRDKADPIVFHDLRHTFGTLAVQVWPLHDVQGYMGHADISTTMIYVHHVPKATAASELQALVAAEIGAGGPVTHSAETPA